MAKRPEKTTATLEPRLIDGELVLEGSASGVIYRVEKTGNAWRLTTRLFTGKELARRYRLSPDRCGAKTPKGPCKRKAIWGRRRCMRHGGASTGPRSASGKAQALANLRRRHD